MGTIGPVFVTVSTPEPLDTSTHPLGNVFPDAGWAVVVLTNHDTSIKPAMALGRQLIAG